MSAFGVPITDETLKRMSKYKDKEIGQEDRAREALRMIQAEGKNMNALSHAVGLKQSYGNGISALCLIYNATGSQLELVSNLSQDWHGSLYKEEPDHTFENGQWIAFLHTSTYLTLGGASEAARVYRGTNVDGDVCDYLVSWFIPYDDDLPRRAYTKVGPKDGAQPDRSALEIARKITIDDSDQHCKSIVSMSGYTTSECIAILQHKFGPLN